MKHRQLLAGAAVALLATGCSTVVLAPGAERVRLTRAPSDVANCVAAGNIEVPAAPYNHGYVDPSIAEGQFRNQAIGFGANWGLVTEGPLSAPVRGIAYRCSSSPSAPQASQ